VHPSAPLAQARSFRHPVGVAAGSQLSPTSTIPFPQAPGGKEEIVVFVVDVETRVDETQIDDELVDVEVEVLTLVEGLVVPTINVVVLVLLAVLRVDVVD